MNGKNLIHRILKGGAVSRDEALAVLRSDDNELLAMLDAIFTIRRYYFGRGVGLHVIRNARSGSCSEDCPFCSQSILSKSDIPRYPLISAKELIEGARRTYGMNAIRYCIVTGGREPSKQDIDIVCEAVGEIKNMIPIEICTSLGLLVPEQARKLKATGVDRYNHNLESSARFFSSVCTSHSHADRVKLIVVTPHHLGGELSSTGHPVESGSRMGDMFARVKPLRAAVEDFQRDLSATPWDAMPATGLLPPGSYG